MLVSLAAVHSRASVAVPDIERLRGRRPGREGAFHVGGTRRGWPDGGQAGLQSRAARRAADSYHHDVTGLAHLAAYLERPHTELDQDRQYNATYSLM